MNACDVGRERVHAHFDETPDAPASESLRLHLRSCPGCRELFDELAILRDTLRARPNPSFPSADLEVVWDRTVRRPRWLDARKRAAVAAVLVTGVSLSTLWLLRGPVVPPGPTPAEIARAEAQADLVLSYTARALAATRTATTRDVVGSKVSPAVRGTVPADLRRH
jgi:predicted anti-sigma-YlaC factor YlaD